MFLRRRLVAALAVTSIAVVATAVGSGVTGAQASTGQQPGPEVSVTPLHGPNGEPLQEAFAINERGQVAAMTNKVSSSFGDVLVWQRGRTTPVTPEGVPGWPADISDRGQVVGIAEEEGTYVGLPFSWWPGDWRTLPLRDGDDIDGGAVAVNNRGQVFGRENRGYDVDFVMTVWQGDRATRTPVYSGVDWARPVGINDRGQATYNVIHMDRSSIAYQWQVGGEPTDIGNLGGPWTRPTDINNQGQIVGSSLTGSGGAGEEHAFLWEDGEMTDLGTLGGSRSVATAVNEHGQVVGSSLTEAGEEHAFLWEDGEMTDLGTLGGAASIADDINNQGQIVGRSMTQGSDRFYLHGFVWEDGEMTDLYAPIESPLYPMLEEQLLDINDRGQIAGTVPLDVFGRAYLWTVH